MRNLDAPNLPPDHRHRRALPAMAVLALLTACAPSPVLRIDPLRQGKPWFPPAAVAPPSCPQTAAVPLAPLHLFGNVSWDSAARWLDQASGEGGSPFLPDSLRFSLDYREDPCAGQDSSSRLLLRLVANGRIVDSLVIPHSAPVWSGNAWELETGRARLRVLARWDAPFALGEPPVRNWFERMGRTFQSPEPIWFRSAIWEGIPRRVLHMRLHLLHHGRRSFPDAGFLLRVDLDSLRITRSNTGEEPE